MNFIIVLKQLYIHQKVLLVIIVVKEKKTEVFVDACLANEILTLWSKGIRTTGCCCGHGSTDVWSWISVKYEDIHRMEELGYQHRLVKYMDSDEYRKDMFIPKSTKHYFDGYSQYLIG